ncbi:hypothetical protein K7432_013917 [Basidiobolus ranarum]|uniref:Metallo-beta-lactamase domain-containing protein n=1 Tax=Basidiobolus ranarum TaxID=34480 RepID=A0ABR2WIH4_9FUNG
MDRLSKLPDYERFEEVAPGLFRCTFVWSLGLGLVIPIATFLIRAVDKQTNEPNHDWIMIDAGAPLHTQKITEAIDAFLTHKEDRIRYIAITHGHIDHTGATLEVLKKYPECKVIMHELEKPFICDGVQYKSCVGDNMYFNMMKHVAQKSEIQVPHEDSLLLTDDDENWEYGHILRLVETLGHTPGSASYLHVPTRSIMVGDALTNNALSLFGRKPPAIGTPFAMATCNFGDCKKAIAKVSTLGARVDTVFPAHDFSEKGLPIEDVKVFADQLQ